MGNLTAKLKGMSYKDLLINHVEKFVVGLVGLLALSCVFGARWSGIEGTPEELEKKVEEARQQIEATPWPEAEKQAFANSEDIQERARKMVASLDGGKFGYKNRMFVPLYDKREPIREPDFLTVENLTADSGHVILALRPEGSQFGTGESGMGPDGPVPPDESGARGGQETAPGGGIDPDLAPRRKARSGPGAGGYPGATGPEGPADLGMQPQPATAEEMAAAGTEMGPGMSGYGAGTASQNGRGARYVAVRGVFPLQSQIRKVAGALHEMEANVANLVDILDFELQRQTAVDGPDPWSGEWEPVSKDVALDILEQVEAFDPDIVDSGIISDVMTMPIPSRIVGLRDSHTTHSRVENFKLSKDEKDRLAQLNERIIEKFNEQKAQQPERAKRGGFATKQYNIRGMTREVLSGSEGAEFMNQYNTQYGKDLDAEGLKRRLEDLQSRASAIGRLLLFRYFDFDVEPGRAYRYRVRLSLLNPNFDRPVEELLNPDSAKGTTRWTDWSEPTPPVTVEKDVEYFLAGVETPYTRPDDSTALIDVFQWDPDIGTTVNKKLKIDFGQLIGGKTEAEVIDPAKQTFKEEDYEFKTGDTLVDMEGERLIKDDMHPDLILTKEMQGKLGTSLGISDQVLVMNKYGEIVTMDDVSDRAAYGLETKKVTQWQEYYADLKEKAKPQASGDGLDAYAAEMGMYPAADGGSAEMMHGPPTGPRPRNPLDRRNRKGKRGKNAPQGSYPPNP